MTLCRRILLLSVCFVAACGTGEKEPAAPTVTLPPECNGSAALCAKRFNEVTFLTTHNAMSNADDPWVAPNQNHPIRRQLADGVRGISLDMHENTQSPADVLTCHSSCAIGSRLLQFQLQDIRDFLAANTDTVVSILYESAGVSDAQVAHVVNVSGLTPYVYTQATDATWPTLGDMVRRNRRLVLFSQDGAGVPGVILPMWKYTWDNPYAAKSTSDFSCAVGRGDARNTIMQINHFITAPVAGEYWAKQANTYASLQEHVARCHAQWHKWPTFLWVDWYATGDALQYVMDLDARE